ncbi:helix-turn-helix domain-containing protein [Mycobacterium sp. SMC-8]|uniref:helix-turn-helix domain-containing protein n=1 Tax=Mycobacterium sp. SMC-8 TaxID=2857060 RepID=UPI0021B3AF69|nr:helix-turn-helix domain-containing protein [Mycobacterium sp. SMC-8]UXA12386.1 helix-turn-helix domain-containing protein [Mycobacterium sp. SMC-8]
MNSQTTAPPRMFSIREAAEHVGLSERLIWQKVTDGDLTHVRVGSRVLIAGDDLAAFIDARRTRGGGKPVQRDEQTNAALQVLAAVKANVIDNDTEAMLRRLRGSSREVSLRLAEATNLLAHLVKMSERPEQMLAALIETVTNAGTD